MSTSTQLQRSMAVATPLPFDTLLLLGFTGEEGISRLFHFQLDLAAPNASAVAFEALLGRPVSIRLALPGGSARFISGICSRLSQGTRSTEYTTFGMEVVPAAWVLTRRARSRIRQGASVPDILREVFQEIPDVTFELRGRYAPRDYCVQYRETDFNFASRLMEEEGIYYYFRHEAGAHHMIVSDRQEFPALQPGALVLQPLGESILTENRITHWEKSQRLGSTKVTLHDHTFELPHQKLAAEAWVQESVTVGRASHKLRVGKSSALEIYDWPGEYAQRFDGIDRGGHDRPADLQEIYQDNLRTAQLRAQEEAAAAITIRGAGRYRHLCSGHTFTITERSPETYANTPVHDGQYVLTSVSHVGRVGESYRSGGQDDDLYHNSFTCLPVGLPFRPRRTTPKPLIQGAQSAVVVGPVGEEIHTDKYGRVRVQFHWDREARGDDSGSCWIRVAQIAGGGLYSAVHIPRVGQEVLVQFEEGDPDRPIIVGSLYNPTHMPPFGLPENKMISGLRTNSYPGGGGYNEIIVNDTKGNELIRVHGQHDMDSTIEHDLREHVLNNRSRDVTNNETVQIGVDQTETVGKNRTQSIGINHTETIGANRTLTVGANQKAMIGANKIETVAIASMETVGIAEMETIGVAKVLTVGAAYAVNVGVAMNTIVGVSATEQVGAYKSLIVGNKIEIKCGASRIVMESGGKVTIEGTEFLFAAKGPVKVKGSVIDLN